jgi:Family of unknown function (DUF6789)
MRVQRSLRGGVAGAVATVAMTLEQTLDKRLFESEYDDVEILGKLVTRGDDWQRIGFALHVENGALFGAVYAQLKPFLPGPAVLRGLLFGLVEHIAVWPTVELIDRFHPARGELPKLAGNRQAFAQATIRHAVFGIVLGLLEDALNDRSADEPPDIPVSTNGHGNIERAVAPASA